MEKSKIFKETYGYSITISKLMKKYNCSTLAEYQEIRKQNKKANRKPKPIKVSVAKPQVSASSNKKKR